MSALASFKGVKQVRVEAPHMLEGFVGRIVRRRKQDNGAWVRMDCDLPESLRSFPVDDERARDFLLYPDQCEAVQKPEPAKA